MKNCWPLRIEIVLKSKLPFDPVIMFKKKKKCSAKKVIPIDLDQRRNGNPLQYSCLENPMDRGAWRLQSMSHKELHMTEHTCTQALT